MAAVAPVAIQSWKVCAVAAVAPVMVNVSVIASEQVELVVVIENGAHFDGICNMGAKETKIVDARPQYQEATI